jgi:hypothetical protein
VRLEGAQRRGGLVECGGGGAEGWWAAGDSGEEASSNEENSNQRRHHRTYSRQGGSCRVVLSKKAQKRLPMQKEYLCTILFPFFR